MHGQVIEVNQSKKYAGRTNIKWILLEIHDSSDRWNKNGITWKEEYIKKNIDSVRNMPIAAEFLDELEKDEPHGHGLTDIRDGEPIFEDSVVVGVAEHGYIDTVEINNRKIKALIAEGYIYNQRYPEFVKWLKNQMSMGKMPETSVEICASDGNSTIIYEDGYKEKGRVPMIFDFSGSAILGIPPADNSALVIELNQKKGEKSMAENKDILELSQKLDEKNTEINSLKDSLKAKEDELKGVTAELNEKTEEVDGLVNKLKEVESELNELKKENEDLTSELNELKEFKKEVEEKRLISELNSKLKSYTEEEIKVVETEINEFKESPTQEKLNKIISEINSTIAKKVLEERKNAQKSEQNSFNAADDIFGDIYEANSNEETSSIDELL